MCWTGFAARAQTRPAIAPPPTPTAAATTTSGTATTSAGAVTSGTAAAGTGVALQATADPKSVVSQDSYVIGPGDQLQLNVWNEPKLSQSGIPVRPDGRISVPLLGDVPAAGLTPMLLGRDVENRLQKYVADPKVTVTMLGVAPKEIFLLGEIGRPGPLVLSPGMTFLQVISAAGGLTPYAKKKLYVLRKTDKGQQKINFDYKKAVTTGDMQGVTLMPGDTIVSR
ncbi:polysaccharide biosynthesis/export family protein [Terriglobus aquaticus]|uniref:Polysaccharide biosynthesis/export family protein n=1 Tax=Terriglobus aquaticus TaxID=940139 RepID=A0ABW9KGK3_9BACT